MEAGSTGSYSPASLMLPSLPQRQALVGLDDSVARVVELLTQAGQPLQVITITGPSGRGEQ
jgi:hypothetical protein